MADHALHRRPDQDEMYRILARLVEGTKPVRLKRLYTSFTTGVIRGMLFNAGVPFG